MKNSFNLLCILICIFCLFYSSCTKENKEDNEPSNTPSLEERFIGTYSVTDKTWAIFPNGERYLTNERNRFVEIKFSNNDFSFYIDGIWQFTIDIKMSQNGILYFNVNPVSGYFSNGGTFFDLQGSSNNSDLDYTFYHGSFNGNTGKFQVCYEFVNLNPYDGYYLQVFDEGYKNN